MPLPDEPKDGWRSLFQVLPVDVYDRFKVQLKRLALANGISPEAFDEDDKFMSEVGPRVQAWECLTVLMERTEDDKVFRV